MTRERLRAEIAVELRDLAINASFDADWGTDYPLIVEFTDAILAIIDRWDNGETMPEEVTP